MVWTATRAAQARQLASSRIQDEQAEAGLVEGFVKICHFLTLHPERLSWRAKSLPDLSTAEGLGLLADKFFAAYRRQDTPALPGTVPDEMVSVILQQAYGYSVADCTRIKQEHQHAMCAENCVGALLERYLDSVLWSQGWAWCCGDFVKAVDFIHLDRQGQWQAVQIKNRDNSENSSSSAIRQGTSIQKWFRTFSRTGETNWDHLPAAMQGFGLSEAGFTAFVRQYLASTRP